MKQFVLTLCILNLALIQTACSQQTRWQQSLDAYLDFRSEMNRFSGTIAIYRDGELVYNRSLGLADRTWQVPVTEATKYDLASVTKMFTATGIALLYEDGLIDLEDTILDHFKDFPNTVIGQTTTIRQLLSHTSGITDFFMQREYLHTDRYRLRELNDYDRFYEGIDKVASRVGSLHYSNTNYMILGRIIEKVSGQDYYSFIEGRLFAPLGMSDTGFFEHDLVIKNLAKNYTRDAQASAEFGVPNDDKWRANTYMRPVKGMPAGGAYSSTFDLFKFMSALRESNLIREDTYRTFTHDDGDGYALGFQHFRQEDNAVIGHSGGFYGVSAMAFYLPEHEYTICILSNTDFGAQPVFDRFLALVAGRETHSPKSYAPEKLKSYTGNFEITEGEMAGKKLGITVLGDHLLFDNELEFYPFAEHSFFDIDNESFSLLFTVNTEGKIVGFKWSDGRNFTSIARAIGKDEMPDLNKIELSNGKLRDYLGEFEFDENGMMPGHRPNVEINKGALLIDGMMRFLPFETDKFFLQDDPQMQLHFIRGQENLITGFHVKRGDQVVGRVKKLKLK